MGDESRTTYVLIDGENIDATLGTSILGRRPRPEERPRWERLLQFVPRHLAGGVRLLRNRIQVHAACRLGARLAAAFQKAAPQHRKQPFIIAGIQ